MISLRCRGDLVLGLELCLGLLLLLLLLFGALAKFLHVLLDALLAYLELGLHLDEPAEEVDRDRGEREQDADGPCQPADAARHGVSKVLCGLLKVCFCTGKTTKAFLDTLAVACVDIENVADAWNQHDDNLECCRTNQDANEHATLENVLEDVQLATNTAGVYFIKDLGEDEEVVDACVAVLLAQSVELAEDC